MSATDSVPPPASERDQPPPAAEPVRRDPVSRFFGGSPLAVLFRLALLSIVVGVMLDLFDLDAWRLLRGLRELFYEFFDGIWDALDTLAGWFVLGAAIVFPLWLLSRLLKTGTRG